MHPQGLCLVPCAVGMVTIVVVQHQMQFVVERAAHMMSLCMNLPSIFKLCCAYLFLFECWGLCLPCLQQDTAPDVVYSFTPATDLDVTVSTCGSSFDTILFMTRNLSKAASYICNDDDPLCTNNPANSRVDATLKVSQHADNAAAVPCLLSTNPWVTGHGKHSGICAAGHNYDGAEFQLCTMHLTSPQILHHKCNMHTHCTLLMFPAICTQTPCRPD